MEMRYRWENNILIPDLGATTSAKSQSSSSSPSSSSPSSGSTSVPTPDLGSCLLHQKLQMLNCCIERKIKREAAGYGHEDTVLHEASSSVSEFPDNDNGGKARKVGSIGSSSDDDEDEFFECDAGDDDDDKGEQDDDDDDEEGGAERKKGDGEGSSSEGTSPKRSTPSKRNLTSDKSVDSSVSEASFKDASLARPEGRLAPMKNARSLGTGEALFIPVTQEPSPMTEDMLEEQAEVLAKLGSTAEGSQLRARMQSACLLSDMESFKAANPGCCLEDFVRWYSPRDYIEEDEEEEGEERLEVGRGKEEEEGSEKGDDGRASKKSEAEAAEAAAASSENDSPPPEEDSAPSENPDSPEAVSKHDNSSDGASDAENLEAAGTPYASATTPDPDSSQAASNPDNSGATESDADSSKMASSPKPAKAETSSGPSPPPMPTSCRQRRGHLSPRMLIPGNMWVEVWQSARHVPARRQRRLFDDTKEAEKVLHFLSGLRPSELVVHLLPMLIHASVLKLARKEDPDVPVLRTLTDQVIAKAVKVSRGPHPPDVKRYEDVIRMIELAETVSSRAQSLKSKFTRDLLEKGKAEEELHSFVSCLLQQPEVDVRGGAYGPAGSAIHKLFSAAQKAALMILEDEENSEEASGELAQAQPPPTRSSSKTHEFPNASAREYILRAMIPRPAPYSRVLPQRMYCVLVDGDYRLAGAFCSDTTFQ